MLGLSAIVLAAGLGKRMRSAVPKVLHAIAGRPLVHYPVRAALEAGAGQVVVVASPETYEAMERSLTQSFGAARIRMAVQSPPRGTGDAARVGLERVDTPRVLILCGDTPLVRVDDLRALLSALAGGAELAVLTCQLEDPTGYGRVLRDPTGGVREIREHRDLDDEAQRAVREVNAGMYVADAAFLRAALARLQPANAQGELYLTDAVAMAAHGRGAVGVPGDRLGLVGVNDRTQLVAAEEALFRRIAEAHAARGVTVRGDARIEDGVELDEDVTIETGVNLRGKTRVGRGAAVDVGCVLTDVSVGEGARVGAYSVLTGVSVEAGSRVPPLTHREA